MKRIPWRKERRIEQRLFFCVIAFIVLSLLLAVLAVLFWMPLIIGEGVLMTAFGALHLLTAYKGWDRFFSYDVGGMSDSHRSRHIHTVLSGIVLVLFGMGGTVMLSLAFFGAIG